ncbi:transporter substrate-binding domain-containing protein [Imhoffiella purpurea]|uniref:Putative extracellular solute-binding protein n=1 Tax=Imhoffiella purpurea TaxID=1249627 RepID=W9W0M9_9GAMM|nr:transporter substrate-binding domain-containing protein [Imhoffiella purpurea]EXJ16170.1 putative extracellular solute-binding protein [Imhoffiella purpurea]
MPFARTTLLLIAAAVLLGMLLWPRSGDDSFDRILDADSIRIGYAIEPPYAFVDGDGEVMGESPEVARRILSRLGIERISWYQMQFDELIPALQTGRIDVIAAGLFVTPARAERVLFSRKTFRAAPALLVPDTNPHGLASLLDLQRHPELKIAVLEGAVEESLLVDLHVSPSRLIRVPDARTGYAAVGSGLADAMLLSAPSLRWCIRHGTCPHAALIQMSERSSEARCYGRGAFAFRRSDSGLAEAWNEAARTYLGSTEHLDLLSGLGFGPAESPATIDTEPDCDD